MGSFLSTKYKNYCAKNEDSFFCSCYRYNFVHKSYSNEFECIASIIIYGIVITGTMVILGGVLTFFDFIPDVLDLIFQIFSNFQFLGNYLLQLGAPLKNFVGKLIDIFQRLADFLRETFPNTNMKLINIMISEIAAIILVYTWYGVDEEIKNWKGSVGYNVYHTLDTPFRLIRESLSGYNFLKFLFNLITLPPQATIFVISFLINLVEELF